jgi:hypothetical protein
MNAPDLRRAAALDLIESDGWGELLEAVERESLAARRVLFAEEFPTAEARGLRTEYARGGLRVLYSLLSGLYQRADLEMPESLKALLE